MTKNLAVLPFLLLSACPDESICAQFVEPDPLFALSPAVWQWQNLQDRTIPVCWDQPSTVSSDDQALVRRIVEASWNVALDHESVSSMFRVRFVGWGPCVSGDAPGVHIVGWALNPSVSAIGARLDGKQAGVRLNMALEACEDVATHEFCVRSQTVHEFGHVLGFVHEQNRPDTPSYCDEEPAGTDGDLMVGPWDLDSVMNYCNPLWSGHGHLSDGDIEGARFVYYPWLYERVFCPTDGGAP